VIAAACVYVLCTVTSLACAVMLLRGYGRSSAPLLLWSGIAFLGFSLGNALLIVDAVILPSVDLSLIRAIPTVLGLAALLYGLIWEGSR
jgi:hypothetical protein